MKKLLTLIISIISSLAASSQLTAVSVNMYTYLDAGSNQRTIRDGIAVLFNNHSDTVDLFDARKLSNPAENIAILRDNVLLAGEHRTSFDTIPITTWQLMKRDYELEIFTMNIADAYLEDTRTHVKKAIAAGDTLRYRFTNRADNTPQDSSVAFWLIFAKLPVVPSCGNHPHHHHPRRGHKELKLYPNPVVGSFINLEMKNITAASCKVTILGKNYSSSRNFVHGSECSERINTTDIPAGFYYFIIEDQEGWKETRQIFIE